MAARRFTRSKQPRKFGGKPSPAKLYKEMNKTVKKKTTPVKQVKFVLVSVKIASRSEAAEVAAGSIPDRVKVLLKEKLKNKETYEQFFDVPKESGHAVFISLRDQDGKFMRPTLQVIGVLRSGEFAWLRGTEILETLNRKG